MINETVTIKIVSPVTWEPVGVNEVGEILVTRMHPDHPLVRFATGDMSAFDMSAFTEEQSPCGRTAKRIKGWMGRADHRTKVRGVFVDPAQIQLIRKEHPDVSAVRLLVSRANVKDTMNLQYNTAGNDAAGVGTAGAAAIDNAVLVDALKRLTGLTGAVEYVEAALPNDGIVIDDQRELG